MVKQVLFCGGSPKTGSWRIRGLQIADMREEWTAVSDPDPDELADADILVVVKRLRKGLIRKIREARKPVVWDAVDFWRQPDDGIGLAKPEMARRLAYPLAEELEPMAIIAANHAMATDLHGLAPLVTPIYHHSNIALSPARFGKVLYYDGEPRFLGEWRQLAQNAAQAAGWEFRMGFPEKQVGALLAVRGGDHGSWLARRWKSNVKAANAITLGVPLLAWPESGYTETLPSDMGLWFTDEAELSRQMQRLNDPSVIAQAKHAAAGVREQFTIAAIARHYDALFERIL